ncbi:hypothetical protein YC2023_014194 [Brassica napus]
MVGKIRYVQGFDLSKKTTRVVIRLLIDQIMEDDDATGGNWVSVPVTMATTVEDEASQEGSIPVTQVNDEDATRLATMLQSKENDEEEEY